MAEIELMRDVRRAQSPAARAWLLTAVKVPAGAPLLMHHI
jgi:hypothetical protein